MTVSKASEALCEILLKAIYSIPEGEKIKGCIQCGTCGASCPTSWAMDYTPREIIASLRAGMLDKVLKSNTMWLCTSCYLCTVRCPAGIKFTDFMFELKRLAIEYGLETHQGTPVLAKTFVELATKHGRIPEAKLIAKYKMQTGMTKPWKLLSFAMLGLSLYRRGRLPLGTETIKGLGDLHKLDRWTDTKKVQWDLIQRLQRLRGGE